MSDEVEMTMSHADLQGEPELSATAEVESSDSDAAAAAFEQASTVTDAEPIHSLGGFSWRRRTRERIALLPDEVELATASVKLRAREQDVGLKRMLALFAVIAVGFQLLVADLILMPWIVLGAQAPSDAVLIAWMSSTVVESIGIVAIVARNLFPGRRRRRKKKKKEN